MIALEAMIPAMCITCGREKCRGVLLKWISTHIKCLTKRVFWLSIVIKWHHLLKTPLSLQQGLRIIKKYSPIHGNSAISIINAKPGRENRARQYSPGLKIPRYCLSLQNEMPFSIKPAAFSRRFNLMVLCMFVWGFRVTQKVHVSWVNCFFQERASKLGDNFKWRTK